MKKIFLSFAVFCKNSVVRKTRKFQQKEAKMTKMRRLQERIEDIEDLIELRSAIERNARKPGVPWEQVKTELDLD
jgi:hypothetical protein